MWEESGNALLGFKCTVGHEYSADSLLVEHAAARETALWTALRALREGAGLSRRLAAWARERGHPLAADRLEEEAQELDHRSDQLGQTLGTD
jgi:two-component system chemotaxis response regulator CheB